MKSIVSAIGSALLVAFGLYGGGAVTQTAASLGVKSGDALKGVEVELRERAGGQVVGRATTDAEGKFAFRDVPEGEYTLALTLAEKGDDTSKPKVKKCRLTLTGARGGPLKKDLDLKAEKPPASAIKKLPGKPKPGEITLTRATYEFEGGGAVEGVITVR